VPRPLRAVGGGSGGTWEGGPLEGNLTTQKGANGHWDQVGLPAWAAQLCTMSSALFFRQWAVMTLPYFRAQDLSR
jgi:hypothetical protein